MTMFPATAADNKAREKEVALAGAIDKSIDAITGKHRRDTRIVPRLTAIAFCTAQALAALPARADPGFADVPTQQEVQHLAAQPPVTEPPGNHPPTDHSGRKQAGKASFYGQRSAGRNTKTR